MRKTDFQTPRRKRVTKQEIRRAVASSTAIETGQSISQIERTLRTKNSEYSKVSLAE